MIYTPQMRQAVKSIPVPKDFRVDIVEYDLVPKFIGLRFFESQWMHYSESERLVCLGYLEAVRQVLTSYGVPVTLEPVIDTGESLPEEYRKAYNS